MRQDHPDLSVRRQCSLLSLTRSGLYYPPRGESAENLAFMEIVDRQFLETPWYGSRQMARHMQREGHKCGRHRVRRLMRLMRMVPIYQEPKTSKKHPEHKIYPYLLRGLAISRPNQVWCTDISYIPMRRGFLYLVAIMDWHSRKVRSWRLSNSMDAGFCVEALKEALARYGKPEIFNSDQGSQFSFAHSIGFADTAVLLRFVGAGKQCYVKFSGQPIGLRSRFGLLARGSLGKPARTALAIRTGAVQIKVRSAGRSAFAVR